MGHVRESYGRAVQTRASRKRKTRNQLEELREENKQLREVVAYPSEFVLTQITGVGEPKEQSAGRSEEPRQRRPF
jgi:hypothetical protein